MSKTLALACKEFYYDLSRTVGESKAVMSRMDAIALLNSTSYFDDLPIDLQNRFIAVINTKTNWGKNILLQSLQVSYLEWFLGV